MPLLKANFKYWITLLCLAGMFSVSRAGDSISVYIFLSETCPICQNQTFTLRQLYAEYSTQGVSFTGVFPNSEFSGEESIKKFGKKYKLEFELKKDEAQALTKRFSATTTPQVFVIRNTTGEILYNGKTDNSFEAIGKKRQVITEHYLHDALENILHRQPVAVKETQPVGCFIIKN